MYQQEKSAQTKCSHILHLFMQHHKYQVVMLIAVFFSLSTACDGMKNIIFGQSNIQAENNTPEQPDRQPENITPGQSNRQVKTIHEAWIHLPESGQACGDKLVFDYGLGGGMRNVYCRALRIFSWQTFIALAPVKPFLRGPHNKSLSFTSKNEFGYYNPEFVRWANHALIPAAQDSQLRRITQPVYDKQFRTLARVYAKVDRALQSDSTWVEKEMGYYLKAVASQNTGSWDFFDPYHDVLGNASTNWDGNDPNHVRSAVMWWLRRSIDQTAYLWREGLARLLDTYDTEWWNRFKHSSFKGKLPLRKLSGDH